LIQAHLLDSPEASDSNTVSANSASSSHKVDVTVWWFHSRSWNLIQIPDMELEEVP